MKALTLIEPWGWAIAHAGKRYEHRTWKPWSSIIGEPIAIHAGKQYDDLSRRMIERGIPGLAVPLDTPRGIVAVVTVRGWIDRPAPEIDDRTSLVKQTAGVDRFCDLRWYGGGLAWVLEQVVALSEPIPCRGALGLWDVAPDIEARTWAQVKQKNEEFQFLGKK